MEYQRLANDRRSVRGYKTDAVPKDIIDEVIQVSNEDSFAMAQKLNQDEGFPAGISSGATIHAAIELAKRPEMAGKRIVVIAASTTERYLSTPLAESVRDEVANLPVSEI